MRWKTSIFTSSGATGFGPVLYPGNVAEAARVAAELGFEGIEVMAKGPSELTERDLRELLDRYALELSAVASGRIYFDEKASLSDPSEEARHRVIARGKELIAYAAKFKAPVIIGLLRGTRVIDGDRDRAVQLIIEGMQAFADHAASLGMPLLLETINRYETTFFNTAEETVDVIRQIGRPNVKVHLDVFHMNIEEVSIGDAIRATGDLLGHVHVSDSNRRAPGMGHVKWDDIFKALEDVGYTGWLSGEHFPLPDDYSAAKQTRIFTRRV